MNSIPTSKENDANPRLIAFYLPQFHPIPENDAWWGQGFTEWTNVTKAKPLFPGHYQPHLPTDLGFYDLRVRETRRDQIRIAKEYGIDGFCYHYYWFSGTRLLNQPLDDMLADPESDMPFCLCWANENWTRRWDGAEREILIAQHYHPDDALEFIKSVIPFFADPRYIRLNGMPFLVVYCPQHLKDPHETISIWRDFCRLEGIGEIHLCAALIYSNEDYAQYGFDSGVEFPPHNSKCINVAASLPFYEPFLGNVISYDEIARSYLDRKYRHGNVFRALFPSWDNTARTGSRAVIVIGSTPENYGVWLAEAIRRTCEDFPEEDRFVFINAWNEWAEGCHLEPDRRHQRGFLEATLEAKLGGKSIRQEFSQPEELNVEAIHRRTLQSDLYSMITYHGSFMFGRMSNSLKKFPRLRRIVRWLFNR